MEVCWSVNEKSRSNVIQILEKYGKRPLSKNENTEAVRHFEENDYQGEILHANRNKIDLSVERLWTLKIPFPVHSSFFTSYPIPMSSILGLKFKLKSKL